MSILNIVQNKGSRDSQRQIWRRLLTIVVGKISDIQKFRSQWNNELKRIANNDHCLIYNLHRKLSVSKCKFRI